jgi:SAM-dependent methyltransferase
MSAIVYGTPSTAGGAEKNADRIHERMLDVVLRCRPTSILEVGAGKGVLGAALAKRGIEYVGIEPVLSEIGEAKRRYPELKIIQASCYDEPEELRGRTFDLVYSNDVIEHLYEPRRLATFSKAHLRPGGRIVCGTPDYGNYWRNLALSLANRWDHHHNPAWDGGHIKFFSKATLGHLWADGGFSKFVWGSIPSRRCPLFPMYLYCTAEQ